MLANEGAQDIVGVRHVRLQMRLLNEWLCVSEQSYIGGELPVLAQEFKAVVDSFQELFSQGIELARKEKDTELLPILTTTLQEFRAVAVHAAGKESINILKEAFKDEKEDVRSAAIYALAKVSQGPACTCRDMPRTHPESLQ
jgi:HEAT repeat protein